MFPTLLFTPWLLAPTLLFTRRPPTRYPQQDLLTYSCKGLGAWAHHAATNGIAVPREVYSLLHAGTFATLTNVNFDDDRFKVGVKGGICHEVRVRCASHCHTLALKAKQRLPHAQPSDHATPTHPQTHARRSTSAIATP